MLVSDFRVGNLVTAKKTGETFTLDLWGLRVIAEGNYQNSYVVDEKVFEPILLTEEWLIQFGYIKFETKLIYCEWFLNFDGILKYKIFQSDRKGFTEFTMPHSDKPINIQYVHQLQNLIYALTGTELTHNIYKK